MPTVCLVHFVEPAACSSSVAAKEENDKTNIITSLVHKYFSEWDLTM